LKNRFDASVLLAADACAHGCPGPPSPGYPRGAGRPQGLWWTRAQAASGWRLRPRFVSPPRIAKMTMRRPSRRIQRSRALPARIWSPWTGSGPPGRDSATVFGGGAALRFLTLDRKRRHVPHAAQQAGCKDRAAAARAAGGAPGGRASAGRGRSQAVGEGGHNDDIPFPGRTLNIAEHERSSFLAAPIQYPLRGFLLYSDTAVTDGVSGGTGPSASSLIHQCVANSTRRPPARLTALIIINMFPQMKTADNMRLFVATVCFSRESE